MTSPDTLPLLLEHLRAGRAVTLRARGASMRPALQDGDVVTLAPPRRPLPGDVVCAQRGGALRLHRVVAAEGTRLLLRGDALRADDSWFDAAEVCGVVRAVHRGGQPVSALLWRGALPPLFGRLARVLRRTLALLRIRRTSDHLQP